MNKREQRLIEELADRYPCRACGGVHYPQCWMTKTREKLVRDGVLHVMPCKLVDEVNVSLRVG